MTIKTFAGFGLAALAPLISGCSGGSYVTNPVAPTPPPAVQVAIPATDRNPGIWLGGTYTLTAVSLYGLVYERRPPGEQGSRALPFIVKCAAWTPTRGRSLTPRASTAFHQTLPPGAACGFALGLSPRSGLSVMAIRTRPESH